jgi:hypothetical protein
MNGVFDARTDMLPSIPRHLNTPRAWCKFTISCFRFSEVRSHMLDERWDVVPLLVVRDVRAVLNSLMKKGYGNNGTTAEEPPLRMRLRRFKEDWDLFRAESWPVIRYDKLLHSPEKELRAACGDLGLPWDEGMLTWSKDPAQIAQHKHGNRTFLATRGRSFAETADPKMAEVCASDIAPGDLAWVEEVFADFNRAEGYAQHIPPAAHWSDPNQWAVPRYANTRRHTKRHPWYAFILKPFRSLAPNRLR